MRPETLDRVENGGSGSDFNPRERNLKEATLEDRALFRATIIQSAAVLEAVQGAAWKWRSVRPKSERRPAVTASARAGVGNLWSGQKKACDAVEQKKGLKQENNKNEKESACIYGGD